MFTPLGFQLLISMQVIMKRISPGNVQTPFLVHTNNVNCGVEEYIAFLLAFHSN